MRIHRLITVAALALFVAGVGSAVSADPGDPDGREVLHKARGRGSVEKVICVDQEAVPAHLAHGDDLIGEEDCVVDFDLD